MARKARSRISYVLPFAKSAGGHRLGVNGLAVDSDQSILYSGGRDGLLCAWDLNYDLAAGSQGTPLTRPDAHDAEAIKRSDNQTSLRSQVQAHTHWVNDVVLAHSNTTLVSASADLTVKAWRPHAEEDRTPVTLGHHNDYVKCLASPGLHSDWVASGGLDHTIRIWDLNCGGEKLQVKVGEEENAAKGSVYALSVQGALLASGGPESTIKLWDSRTGARITKLVGHTDNIRDILINQNGDTVLTASSDQTIKLWSVTGGRCMNTLTMHNDSVWSLYSEEPDLSLFYSTDRSGLIVKTDVRGCEDLYQGLSIAIAQEHQGVYKVAAAGNSIWTATASSSINRWDNVDTRGEIQAPEPFQHRQNSNLISRAYVTQSPPQSPRKQNHDVPDMKIPYGAVLTMSSNVLFTRRDTEAATIYSGASMRKMSEAIVDPDPGPITPCQAFPSWSIKGQNGLIKHVMLNDRKRVLTSDTAGEVILWDLIRCVPIKSFGKSQIEDILPLVNTAESIANWCTVDTRTGRLACILEENICFEAEMYADDIIDSKGLQFKEDQRINLGKWILRYLFAGLINEEVKRDRVYQQVFLEKLKQQHSDRIGSSYIPLRSPKTPSQEHQTGDYLSQLSPRPLDGALEVPATPGITIGAAPETNGDARPEDAASDDQGNVAEKRRSDQGHLRTSTDRQSSSYRDDANVRASSDGRTWRTSVEKDAALEGNPQSPTNPEKEEKKEGSFSFGSKFRMKFPKKLGRSSVDTKPPIVDEKPEGNEDSEVFHEEKAIEDSFLGTIQKIRYGFEDRVQSKPSLAGDPRIQPSPPHETPELKLPPSTAIIIQEDRLESGGVVDVYRGTVASVARDANIIEKNAPMWLGDLLLLNQMPLKEVVKISFILLPYEDELPSVANPDGNARLNANRMLRAKKICGYVAERIEPLHQIEADGLRPEDYLELLCQGQVIDQNTTLATLKTHVWKSAGDVVLYYKSNGRKPNLGKLSSHKVE